MRDRARTTTTLTRAAISVGAVFFLLAVLKNFQIRAVFVLQSGFPFALLLLTRHIDSSLIIMIGVCSTFG
jgi:hypothetical protein